MVRGGSGRFGAVSVRFRGGSGRVGAVRGGSGRFRGGFGAVSGRFAAVSGSTAVRGVVPGRVSPKLNPHGPF